ncbi:methyl-accepting chemotaxis protein [Robbsia sp. Bb-Pol-6]|uniref:Methyl-accepting chemotaxis protein n=1 Tax=Robbsia betulipollinis TaxID=2981849 RepID=A0ABT3ZSL2_9BURK|nr:methyl-accepting chemotaxis protein [Robbsia betulipollinis]MCY0389551.1 methyl-accepting chemotaxis protein [Robbsia betulipollinis]
MRINLPVIDEQYDYPASEQLVSVTDLQGVIRYCNPAFVKVSGFSREALIGQPHNVVRHPDMPALAYADLWATVRAGKPWTAIVKNRRLDGRHYWVRANVTPIVQKGRTVGYLSVRVKPSAEEIAAASSAYALLRDAPRGARTHRLALHQGQLRRTGPAGWLAGLRGGTLAGRVTLAMTLPAAATTLCAALPLMTQATPDRIAQSAWLIGILLGTSALAGIGLWRSLARPVAALIDTANRLAACDLDPSSASSSASPPSVAPQPAIAELGELRRALTQLRANLAAIVTDVDTQADGLRHAVAEIAAGNGDLARRTERQAAYLDRTTETIQALRDATGLAREHTRGTADSTAEAAHAAAEGQQVIGRVVSTMESVAQSSQRVGDITAMIDGIAFQTNLLALNAAVEAARAGEHGRGFSVVAGEVRLLAQRCAGAAREISELVGGTVDQADRGASMARDAGVAMQSIVDTFARTVQVTRQLEAAGRRQDECIGQVDAAIAELDTVTQQNAALVEQVAAAAHSQRAQADALSDAVAIFSHPGKSAIDPVVPTPRC